MVALALSVCFIYEHETIKQRVVSRVFQTFLRDFVFSISRPDCRPTWARRLPNSVKHEAPSTLRAEPWIPCDNCHQMKVQVLVTKGIIPGAVVVERLNVGQDV